PNLPPRVQSTARRFAAFVIEDGGRFLVRQRPAGVVNARFWEFPNVELPPNSGNLKRAAQSASIAPLSSLEQFCVIKHTITRYRITLEVYQARFKGERPKLPDLGQWLGWSDLIK